MKVCYVANARSIHTRRWVRYLADSGHKVYLISPVPFARDKIENVELYVLRQFRPQVGIIFYLINSLFAAIQIRRLTRRLKPDILHAHYVAHCGFWAALSRFHPLVVSAWGSDIWVNPETSRMVRAAVKFALVKADIVLTTSPYLKEHLHRRFELPEDKVMALPWGIDPRVFHKGYESGVRQLRARLGIHDSNFVILSPRRLRAHYRVEYIVQAMPYIAAKHPGATLILLKGSLEDKHYESQMNNLAEELGVAQNIRLLRQELTPEEMAVAYNASDVLVSIPKSDQFAISIQEGMACGVIPVVGNLEVYNQYLTNGKNAFFVNAEDPKEMAQRMIYCIEHPELKEKFYEINRKIIEEKEDWNKNAPKMEELYVSLIQKSKGIQG